MLEKTKLRLLILSILLLLIIIIVVIIIVATGGDDDDDNDEEPFKFKIDYNNSLTSLASSILKYFDVEPMHKTLSYIDNLLKEKKPENVILLVFDGLGSRILDKVLNKSDFLIKNRKKEIFSVFPPTTAASLNAIKTGLNPSEHGWVGWTAYVEPIDKIIMLYKDKEKGKDEVDNDFLKIKEKYYYNKKTIVQLINETEKYLAYELNCYPYNVDKDIDSVFNRILETLKIEGKKYIFSYYPEPDDILHSLGIESEEAKEVIKKINQKVEEYSKLILENKNTVMIIVSDHGHLISERVDIKNRNISNYLEKPSVFIENRSPAFLVKKGKEKDFKKEFSKDFKDDFFLLSKEEILNYNIFGEYGKNNKHELFESSIGDFIAFAKDSSNKCIFAEADTSESYSFHGGMSDDEIYVPLIVLSN